MGESRAYRGRAIAGGGDRRYPDGRRIVLLWNLNLPHAPTHQHHPPPPTTPLDLPINYSAQFPQSISKRAVRRTHLLPKSWRTPPRHARSAAAPYAHINHSAAAHLEAFGISAWGRMGGDPV